MTSASKLSTPGRDWKRASGTHSGQVNRQLEHLLEPIMLSFPAWLTADYASHWDTPIDVRYILDQAASHRGLCWLLRGDPHHQRPQLSAIAYDQVETGSTPVEIRPISSPDLDATDWFMIVSELNRRAGIDARREEIHEEHYEQVLGTLPPVTVPYWGKA